MINLIVISMNMRVPRLRVNMMVLAIADNAMKANNNVNTLASSHRVLNE